MAELHDILVRPIVTEKSWLRKHNQPHMQFDITNNTWKQLPSTKHQWCKHDSFFLGDKLYLIGGNNGNMKEIPMEVLDMKNLIEGWSEYIIPGAISPGRGVAPFGAQSGVLQLRC